MLKCLSWGATTTTTKDKRTETTAAPFPELDQQALALVMDKILGTLEGESSAVVLTDEQNQTEVSKCLEEKNFGKLYASTQEYLKSLRLKTDQLAITDGEWRVFHKGSDPKEVVKFLAGFHTQWCIAGEGTAAGYLTHSDLHIYFSKDADNNNYIPRACVVNSERDDIGITEVRGIMSNETAKQHLDDYITPVVEKRLASIPGGKEWSGQIEDIKRLANIHLKDSSSKELSKDDLRFLYEIDRKIHSTGYGSDPRIASILNSRDMKDDLSSILAIPKEQISITNKEALTGNIKYHYGYLNLGGLTSAKGLKLPESVGGDLDFGGLTSTEGLKLPESVGGTLNLRGLTSAKGLEFPKSVGGTLDLGNLTSAKGLKLPESVGGDLDLGNLTSAEGLKLPKSVGRDLNLEGLTSDEGLELPESVGRNIYLGRYLTSAEKNKLYKQYPFLRIIKS